jgi:hypothetical protein
LVSVPVINTLSLAIPPSKILLYKLIFLFTPLISKCPTTQLLNKITHSTSPPGFDASSYIHSKSQYSLNTYLFSEVKIYVIHDIFIRSI